ncbi:hypothetical protein JKP88DRAFT_215117 [Tribonema minus]|uniref:Uncharacterized protein n=1 Tax=Tribonema minus TaxID=303371 RepID=A0A835YTB4_9STRA|nr:hypothetical protein JKP88DRAFT_215117 [Tribonema minus]
MKFVIVLAAMLGAATAFVPATMPARAGMAVRAEDEKHRGVGGMADTRDPEPVDHEDPRKSISKAPTFEEYMKQKQAAQQ